jgi:hypothetical protein
VGLLFVALGDGSSAIAPSAGAQAAFWFGLVLLVAPATAYVTAATDVSDEEAFALVAVVGLSLYCVKILHSPTYFTFPDEFFHWRNVIDVLDTGALFRLNALLPASSAYPGLPVVTAAIAQTGHVSIFVAGLVLIACGRLLLMWSLFALYCTAVRPRVAAFACLAYTANPNFLFFDAQFAYESLALPLAMFVLAWVARSSPTRPILLARALLVFPAVVAVVLTHHMTAAALCAFLVVWALTGRVLTGRNSDRFPVVAAGVAVVTLVSWTVGVAPRTVSYLQPVVREAVVGLARSSERPQQTAAAESQAAPKGPPTFDPARRQLFQNFAGEMAPVTERVFGLASVGLTIIVLPFGVVAVWRLRRTSVSAVALCVIALAYPLTLALRLTEAGTETSLRASEFVFVGVALLAALAFDAWGLSALRRSAWVTCCTWMVVAFTGGVIIGRSPWSRMPGPYRPSADSRSIDSQGIDAARWALHHLGQEQRVIADRAQMRLMLTFGHQHPVTNHTARVNVAEVVFTPELGPKHRVLLSKGRVDYLVLDRRMFSGLPLDGVYFERAEPGTFQHRQPPSPAAIGKFDDLSGVSRLYDSGAIQIYDIRSLQRALP